MKREFLTITFIGFFILISHLGFSQTSISGIINSYSVVDSIYPTKDTLEVASPGLFKANDTVMVYQAKGAEVKTSVIVQEYNFGNVTNFNNSGKYEIILVQKVEGNQVILKANLNSDYDEEDLVQLIRVPSYKNASIDGEVTSEAWDGSKGGVVVLMVGDTLYLNDKIDVTGKGFRGAVPFSSNGNCSSVDSALYRSFYFAESTPTISAGYKGEGIAEFDAAYRKGFGRWANGGGGGNGRFSGGGGGANFSKGGDGGQEDTITCINTPNYTGDFWQGIGGLDGYGLINGIDDSTIYLGGGGGSGTENGIYIASNGGDGGGIVIIIAKAIKSNGDSIIADGESVLDIATASAGGAGGGGAVVFDIESVTGSCDVSVKGGNGGRAQSDGTSGPGGGGGGGVIFWNTGEPGNVSSDISGGDAGYVEDLYPADERNEASPGDIGSKQLNFNPPLTGFLFNWISDDQEICMNTAPDLISGTKGRGGTGSYTYEWYSSPDGSSWSFTDSTRKDFQPPALTDTIYYQRHVISGAVTDKGNIIRITVLDSIKINEISGFDLVECIGNEADSIVGTTVTFGGLISSYDYIWEASTDLNTWNELTPKNDTVCYPGTLTDTTYIRRVVASGACYDTTSNITIVGLPEIANNTVTPDQEICYNDTPVQLSSAEPTGGLGTGTYSYKWIESTDGVTWTDTLSGETNIAYQPPALTDTIYYKRVVTSDDCVDESNVIAIDVLDTIGNNTIDNDLPFYTCYNTEPELLLGSDPTGGTGAYTYQWLDSISGGSLGVIADATNKNYNSVALTDTTYFRRVVNSSACTDTSEFIKISLWDLPIGWINNFTDTVCSNTPININFNFTDIGELNLSLHYSNDQGESFNATVGSFGSFSQQIQPTTLNEEQTNIYTIDSIVDSNGCYAVLMDGADTIVVYGNPIANAGLSDTVCELAYQLIATKSYPNTEGVWSQVSGLSETNFDGQTTSPLIDITVDTADVYTYQWIETNWECVDTATTDITMYENLQDIRIITPDSVFTQGIDTIIHDGMSLEVIGDYINDNFGNEIEEIWTTDNASILVSPGDKRATFSWTEFDVIEDFKIQWYVDKGACLDTTFNLSILVEDFIFVPNGFTPNGDGVNDIFYISGLDELDDNKLVIYNRLGTEVYKNTNYSNELGWDGKSNVKSSNGKELPEDTYYYILTRNKPNGITDVVKGFIVLKRY